MNDDEVWDAVRQTLSDVQMDRPVEAIEQRGRARRRKRHVLGLAAGGGVAAVVALALALPMATGSGTAPAPTGPDNHAGAASPAPAGNIKLVSLAANLTADNASLPGDASLIIEKVDVRRGNVPSRTRYHLYTDSGEYYYTEARNELPRVIARGENLGNGFHTRGVAAARYAATGDLATARERMINSVYDEESPLPAPSRIEWRSFGRRGSQTRLRLPMRTGSVSPPATSGLTALTCSPQGEATRRYGRACFA